MSEHNSSSYLSVISTSCSSSSSENPIKRKRYRKFLYKDYDHHQVSSQTKKKYDSLCKAHELLQANLEHNNDLISGSHNLQAEIEQKSINTCNSNLANDVHNNSAIELNEAGYDMQDNNLFEEELSHGTCDYYENFISSDNESLYSDNDDTIRNSSESGDDTENNCTYSIFDKIMFHASNLSVRDIILMCTAFGLRFHLSDEALLMLISMLKICAGSEFNSLNLSKYMMSKCFSRQNEHVTYHYYCNKCSENIILSVNATKEMKNFSKICEKCQEKACITSSAQNYFVSIDLAYQLQIILSDHETFRDILKNIATRNDCTENDTNIHFRGTIYNDILKSRKNNKHEIVLTLNCNTDGAPLTKSGKRSFWPLQVSLNELSSKFQSRFVLLAGLLMVDKEPKSNLMNLYLSKFVEQINCLYNDGIMITHNDNSQYLIRFCTLSFPVDTVCRPILQNRIQFNGYSGCTWCYQLGKFIITAHGIRYVRDQECCLRCHESHMEDMEKSINSSVAVRGVKGHSALVELPHIDMVWSFSYEYMHSLLLGVVFQLINLWKNKNCNFRISDKNLNIMEKLYLKITPSHEIHRLPRSGIIKGKMKPKASELKSWLLYFSLPCLKNFLPELALEHYALLVNSAYTLLKTDLSEQELDKCENDLIKFVCQFEVLYGKEAMTFNVHALMHCVESVRKLGSLCFNSTFPYENFIYILKKYISGPKGMDRQMARKHLQSLNFKCNSNINFDAASENAIKFGSMLFAPKRLTKFYDQTEKITFCGRAVLQNNELGQCIAYNKCIFNGTIYHTKNYVSGKRTDDSYIQLVSGKFHRILEILHCDNSCMLRLSTIQIYPNVPFPGVQNIYQIENESNSTTIFTNIENIKSKVILVNVEDKRYLCNIPNCVEIQ